MEEQHQPELRWRQLEAFYSRVIRVIEQRLKSTEDMYTSTRPNEFRASKGYHCLEKAEYSRICGAKRKLFADVVPLELILNWEQTGIKMVPCSTWTMEQQSAKRVEVIGLMINARSQQFSADLW